MNLSTSHSLATELTSRGIDFTHLIEHAGKHYKIAYADGHYTLSKWCKHTHYWSHIAIFPSYRLCADIILGKYVAI